MAQCFIDKGYKIISDGADNHCMLIDLRSKGITGKEAENTLVLADITVNKNMVPFDDKSAVTSGMRLGTPAITTRGVKEDTIPQIVELIDEVLMNIDNEQIIISSVRQKVNALMNDYPL